MPTRKHTAQSAAAKPAPADAIELLTQDHAQVKQLFQAYEKLVDENADDEEKSQLAALICMMLTIHATIEEEIFYPAARDVLDHEDLVDEATVEHASAMDLIEQILDMEPDEALFDAKVKVLGEYIDHHVKEEQNEMFPQLKKAGMDTAAVGKALSARKEELMAQMDDQAEAEAD